MKLPFEPELEEKNEPWDVKHQWSNMARTVKRNPKWSKTANF